QLAVDAASAGDTIFLLEGTYAPSANIQVSTSGERTAPISVRPYEGAKVIIDGENMPGWVMMLRTKVSRLSGLELIWVLGLPRTWMNHCRTRRGASFTSRMPATGPFTT